MTAWEHLSESNEHFTPVDIIVAARNTLGGKIDLDPASSPEANVRVLAGRFYSVENPGHDKIWQAETVFLNPPGGICDENFRQVIKKKGSTPSCIESGACGLPPGHTHPRPESSAKRWWYKLAHHWVSGHVDAAIFIGFSLEMLQTFQVDAPAGLVHPLDMPLCFPRVRVPYDKFDGKQIAKGASPPHASFIALLPPRSTAFKRSKALAAFASEFGKIGKVINT